MNIIEQLQENAPLRLAGLLDEARDEINEALVQVAAEAKDNDGVAKLAIPFTMTLNLDKNTIGYALTVTLKSKWQTSEDVDNGAQGKLFNSDGEHVANVTYEANGNELHTPPTGDKPKKGARK